MGSKFPIKKKGHKNNKLKVVIVDENPTYLKVWEKVFRGMDNCSYCLTNDSNNTYKIAKDEKIDLLISEVVMDDIDGFRLAEMVHKKNPKARIILTTTYDCNLKRFNLDNPHFHILHKPYHKIEDVIHFVMNILDRKDPRIEADEDSWSENEEFPAVMEWKL